MSNFDVKYHKKELERASGMTWRPDYTGADSSRLFRQLETSRSKLKRYNSFNFYLIWMRTLGALAFVAGIALGVFSSTGGFDAGTACAALIVPGVLAAITGYIGGLVMTIQIMDPVEAEVAAREDAYNDSLTQEMKS